MQPQAGWSRAQLAWYCVLGGFATFTVVGVLAHFTHQTYLFPSVGPTVFVLYYSAMSRQASPRNVICGQAIGVTAGLLAVTVMGLWGAPVDLTDITWRRYVAVLIAVCLTMGVMIALGVEHGPAAATTLIVALGVLHTAWDLVAIAVTVIVTVAIAFVIHRLVGLPYPWWAPVTPPAHEG